MLCNFNSVAEYMYIDIYIYTHAIFFSFLFYRLNRKKYDYNTLKEKHEPFLAVTTQKMKIYPTALKFNEQLYNAIVRIFGHRHFYRLVNKFHNSFTYEYIRIYIWEKKWKYEYAYVNKCMLTQHYIRQ